MTIKFLKDQYVDQIIKENPRPLNELGEFVYYRTYSRWVPEIKRREQWHETVRRTTEASIALEYNHLLQNNINPDIAKLTAEAELMFKRVYTTKQFPSGRSLWVAGANKAIAEKFSSANFNCAFTNIRTWEDLSDLFHLLLVGCGVGFKSTLKIANDMPKIKVTTKLQHSEYNPVPVRERLENTKVDIIGNYAKIFVGDSKEGWSDALNMYFNLLTSPAHKHVHTIKISYNSIRPKGEKLKTFGGTASGHESLKGMFEGIDKTLKGLMDTSVAPIVPDKHGYGHVRPIHILDIGNLIGYNVVVGGVRRTAEIWLFDIEDIECLWAKYGINGFWSEDHFDQHERVRQAAVKAGIELPVWFDDLAVKKAQVVTNDGVEHIFDSQEAAYEFALQDNLWVTYPMNKGRSLDHRRMSNNSVAFKLKPSREIFDFQFELLKGEGEPAFINAEQIAKRRGMNEDIDDIGINPCAEILLKSKNLCNLSTINLKAFVNADGTLDVDGLVESQKLSVRIGLRMTLVTLELPEWDKVQKTYRLIGCSLTGWKDAMALVNYSLEQEGELLELLKNTAREEADRYAKVLRVVSPLLTTTVKPEGTISQLAGGVSSGVHWNHSPYYIRRIRINSTDPLAQVAVKLGWNVLPEVGTKGESHEDRMKNANTLVIEFPIESGAKVTKYDVSAQEQFDTYFNFMDRYCEHQASNTITVRSDEWDGVADRIWDNWDNFVGVSFLQLDGHTYQLAPYEAITKEQYDEMKSKMSPFDVNLLHELEKKETKEDLSTMESCDTGVCPIR